MGETYTMERALRSLADVMQRQREAGTMPGIAAPAHIDFTGTGGAELNAYRDNPTLLAEIRKEIKMAWPELRERAFARLAAERADLERQIAEGLQTAPSLSAGESGR